LLAFRFLALAVQNLNKMANEFQIWLMNQGYYRKEGSLVWWKDDKIVDGAELRRKLNEWEALAK
jgi:hypothetical protein